MIKRPLVWILLGFVIGNLIYRYILDTYHLIAIIPMLVAIGIILVLIIKEKIEKIHNSSINYNSRAIDNYSCFNDRTIMKGDNLYKDRMMSSIQNYNRGFFLIFILSIFLGFHLMKSELKMEIIEQEVTEPKEVTVLGKIYDISRTEKGLTFIIGEGVVSTKEAKNPKVYYLNEKIQAYLSNEKHPEIIRKDIYKIGNSIYLQGTLSPLSHASNPGQFDEYTYYKARNISFRLYPKEVRLYSDQIFHITYIFYKCRQWLTDQMFSILPKKEASVMNAILFGDKSMLPEDVSDLYQQGGISHMMSVSGLHVSLLGYAMYKLLTKLRRSVKSAIFFSIVFLVCYGALTGYSVSTKRAVIMFSISLGSIIFGKTYDILSSLSLSALIILIQQPRELTSPGFLLSYGAVLGIILIFPKLCNISDSIQNKYIKKLMEGVFLSLSTQLMTLPLLAYFFYEIPLYSVLVNLILVPFSSFLLVSSGIACLISFIFVKVAGWIIGAAYYILKGYEFICGVNAKLPYHYILVGKLPFNQIILYYAILFAVFACIPIIRNRKGKEDTVPNSNVLCIDKEIIIDYKNELQNIKNRKRKVREKQYTYRYIILIFLIPLLTLWKGEELLITCLDVSQGDSIIIEKDGITCLIDCGSSDVKEVGKYRLLPFLKSRGIGAIDYAFISHADDDHINGIYEILVDMPILKVEDFQRGYSGKIKIRNIILPRLSMYDESYQKLISLANEKGVDIHYFSTGDELKWSDVTIRALHPNKNYVTTTKNAHSLVLCLTYNKFQGIFTGDMLQDGEVAVLCEVKKMRELSLIDSEERIEFLKVAHHGSNTSSSKEFLEGINPTYSVISAGKNNRYHHPHPVVCTRFQEMNLPYDLTMNLGAIDIITDGVLMKKSNFLREKTDK